MWIYCANFDFKILVKNGINKTKAGVAQQYNTLVKKDKMMQKDNEKIKTNLLIAKKSFTSLL